MLHGASGDKLQTPSGNVPLAPVCPLVSWTRHHGIVNHTLTIKVRAYAHRNNAVDSNLEIGIFGEPSIPLCAISIAA